MKYLKFMPVVAILVAIAVGALNFARTNAAGNGTLYITPASGTFALGSTVTLTIRENSGATTVNAVSVDATYNTSRLQFLSFDFGNSAFDVAAASSGGGGTINVDRGSTSHALSGDQEVARVNFKVLSAGSAAVNVSGSSVVLSHDNNTDQLATRTGANLTLQSGFENRIAHRPNGQAYHFLADKKYPVPNPTVRNCIVVRSSTGDSFLSSNAEIDAFSDAGVPAHCPYEREVGLNFLKENNAPTIWLVRADGTKQHVGSLCVGDPFTTVLKKFHVFTVPAAELAGHVVGPDWWASGSNCASLPG